MACGKCHGHRAYEDEHHRMRVCMECNPEVPNPPGREPEPPKDDKK